MNLSHLYIHIPFCSGKCGYCSFYSERYERDAADAYIRAVQTELDLRLASMDGLAPETIYFGGGTPSILNPQQMETLLGAILDRISMKNLSEWSIEANPGTLCEEKLSLLVNAGINRISFGVQSFDAELLMLIGRRHTVPDISQSFLMSRSAGISNLGLDLIAGLPVIDVDGWMNTLEKAVGLRPEHVSVYSLSLEPETQLHARSLSGELLIPEGDDVIEMLEIAESSLIGAGFKHYEVSNFARPGFECLHNLSYWQGKDYIGIGPAASSRSGLERWTNAPDLKAYTDALGAGLMPPAEKTMHTPEEDVAERFVFAFRTEEGIDLDKFCNLYGEPAARLRQTWEKVLKKLESDGLVFSAGSCWAPTAQGIMHADGIARELL